MEILALFEKNILINKISIFEAILGFKGKQMTNDRIKRLFC